MRERKKEELLELYLPHFVSHAIKASVNMFQIRFMVFHVERDQSAIENKN